jgi:lauroyl/myristoyl acyltransferase
MGCLHGQPRGLEEVLEGEMMNLVALVTSRWGPSLVMLLCRLLPRPLICRLGRRISQYLAGQHDLPFVRALRANVAVVLGLPEGHSRVDRAVGRLLYNAVVSYADFFRMVQLGPEEARVACEVAPSAVETIQTCLDSGRGLVLVGAHMCSFDILLLGLKEVFPSVQVLSNADPRGSSLMMNRIRAEQGLDVTPISIRSLRKALARLREGGVVAIAADLPMEGGEELTFFGQRSHLPVGHVRLALDTGAHVMVGVSHRVGEGAYRAEVALAPQPESTGNKKQDMLRWAQDSLAMVEGFIHRWPEEWLMPIPVWSG